MAGFPADHREIPAIFCLPVPARRYRFILSELLLSWPGIGLSMGGVSLPTLIDTSDTLVSHDSRDVHTCPSFGHRFSIRALSQHRLTPRHTRQPPALALAIAMPVSVEFIHAQHCALTHSDVAVRINMPER